MYIVLQSTIETRLMVNSLNHYEFRDLRHWVEDRVRREKEIAVAQYNLTRDELEILQTRGRINAIKAVRMRLSIGLSEGLTLVNRYFYYMDLD